MEDIPPRCNNTLSSKKFYPLAASSTLPRSPHTPIERKPMAHAIGFLSIQSPNAASPRRLCQPPWTQPTRRDSRPPLRRNHFRRSNHPKRQPLFGREGSGGRGASLREAASPPRISHPFVFSGRSAREGPFLQKRPLPRKAINPLLLLSKRLRSRGAPRGDQCRCGPCDRRRPSDDRSGGADQSAQ